MARNLEMSLDDLKGAPKKKKDGQLNVRVEAELLRDFKEACSVKIGKDFSSVIRNFMQQVCRTYGKSK